MKLRLTLQSLALSAVLFTGAQFINGMSAIDKRMLKIYQAELETLQENVSKQPPKTQKQTQMRIAVLKKQIADIQAKTKKGAPTDQPSRTSKAMGKVSLQEEKPEESIEELTKALEDSLAALEDLQRVEHFERNERLRK